VVEPNLCHLRELDRLTPDHPYFNQARAYWKKWDLPEESLSNFTRLLCGILDFPALLLLNPSPADDMPFEQMVETSNTLSWLRETLEPLELTLRDIVVIDVFSMLTDDKMDGLTGEPKSRAVREAFDLTHEFLRCFKPPAVISCQCATKPSHARWGFFQHPLALDLCSSVRGARGQRVETVSVEDHIIHVVQGFHPSHVVQTERKQPSSDLGAVLQTLLQTA
jgi:hypothetical protein